MGRTIETPKRLGELSSAFHDFFQSMHGMALLVAQLENGAAPCAVLPHMYRALDELDWMLSAMRDIAKADARLIVPQPEMVSVTALVSSVKMNTSVLVEASRVKVVWPLVYGVVLVDSAWFRRLLGHAVRNAVLLGDGSEVRVAVEERDGVTVFIVTTGAVGRPTEDWVKGLGLKAIKVIAKGLGLKAGMSLRGGVARFSVEVPSYVPRVGGVAA